MRLLENLYLTLDVANLNPGGYDGLSVETFYGNEGDLDTARSNGTLAEGKISGDGAIFITKPIPFINELTGEEFPMSRAHLVVKHQNVADIEIKAELALRPNVNFVKGEVLGVGDGTTHKATLSHTEELTDYKFKVYFDGEAQEGISLNSATGEVNYTAPSGVLVSADYFYNWGTESFIAMPKSGTYPDRNNPKRATTQFEYKGVSGKVATIKLTLKQLTGESNGEIILSGTGKAQGIRLPHQAVESSIAIISNTASWQYNAEQNAIILTAPVGEEVKINYNWRGKEFSVDSFACTFNE